MASDRHPKTDFSLSDASSGASASRIAASVIFSHHWLVRRRGGEKVLEALCDLSPGSPVYTFVHDPRFALQTRSAHPIRTSFLQRVPLAKRVYPALLPLMPLAARKLRLPPADLVVCSDAALAKAFAVDPRSLLVCYCHSPMRSIWDQATFHRDTLPRVARPAFDRLVQRLRRLDHEAAQRVDVFVANSRHVADRIARSYGRESVVIHPPVELPEVSADASLPPRGTHYLAVGYHTAYKRLDLAVEASQALGCPLRVVGEGPEVRRLRRIAPEEVRFLGWLSDAELRREYQTAGALLFPGEEDFGIVPLEATAHGCPVIAYGVGGACETVVEGLNGALFESQTVESLVAAARRQAGRAPDSAAMLAHARRFSRRRFEEQMANLLTSRLEERRAGLAK